MDLEKIKQLVAEAFDGCQVVVTDVQGKYLVEVIGAAFDEVSSLERQKKIYAPLSPYIASGELHAVSVRGYTQEEWEAKQS